MKYLSILLWLVTSCAFAQNTRSIHFQKERTLIYFFQVSERSDTLVSGRNDQFILMIPDSMQENIRIDLDNGKLAALKNDSLVRFVYLPGLRYEASFKRPPSQIGSPLEKATLQVQVNGTTQLERRVVRVQFVDRRNNKIVLENQFNFK